MRPRYPCGMWPAVLALSAFLQAGGVVPGRSCEPGGRDVPTTAFTRAVDVARTVALGMIGDAPRVAPVIDAAPAAPAPTPAPG